MKLHLQTIYRLLHYNTSCTKSTSTTISTTTFGSTSSATNYFYIYFCKYFYKLPLQTIFTNYFLTNYFTQLQTTSTNCFLHLQLLLQATSYNYFLSILSTNHFQIQLYKFLDNDNHR